MAQGARKKIVLSCLVPCALYPAFFIKSQFEIINY